MEGLLHIQSEPKYWPLIASLIQRLWNFIINEFHSNNILLIKLLVLTNYLSIWIHLDNPNAMNQFQSNKLMSDPVSFSYLNQGFLSLNKKINMNLSFWISFLFVSAIAWNNDFVVTKRVWNEKSPLEYSKIIR